eukprot:c43708_g1_i1 orf=2-214(-)
MQVVASTLGQPYAMYMMTSFLNLQSTTQCFDNQHIPAANLFQIASTESRRAATESEIGQGPEKADQCSPKV